MKYHYLSFKEFSDWCNRRAADGKWGMANAIECSQLCSDMYNVFFLKREKVWKEKYEPHMRELVNEIERKPTRKNATRLPPSPDITSQVTDAPFIRTTLSTCRSS